MYFKMYLFLMRNITPVFSVTFQKKIGSTLFYSPVPLIQTMYLLLQLQ